MRAKSLSRNLSESLARPLAGTGGGLPPIIPGVTCADSPGTLTDIPIYAAAAALNSKPIHPSWLWFPNGLWGKKYWLGYMPYFGPDTVREENPCIACSDDGITWTIPAGGGNPIAPAPTPGGNNADICICYYAGTLIAVWLETLSIIDRGSKRLRYKTTTDGINWTGPAEWGEDTHLLLEAPSASNVTSPSLHRHNGRWVLFTGTAHVNDGTQATIHKWTADALTGPWIKEDGTHPAGVNPFHIEMHFVRGKWWCLTHNVDIYGRGSRIWLESADGLAWTASEETPHVIMDAGRGFTDPGFYKSGAAVVDGKWQLLAAPHQWTTPPCMTTLDGETLPDGYFDAMMATAQISDDFSTHGDGSIQNKTTPVGTKTWTTNFPDAPAVDSGDLIRSGGASSRARINAGFSNGVFGCRFSALPFETGAVVELNARTESASGVVRHLATYTAAKWDVRNYNGSAFADITRFYPCDVSGDGLAPVELVMRMIGQNITVFLNGRVLVKYTSDVGLSQTWCGFGFGNESLASRISAFFAHPL